MTRNYTKKHAKALGLTAAFVGLITGCVWWPEVFVTIFVLVALYIGMYAIVDAGGVQ